MLERVGAFPIPNEMIAIVCAFWLRAGEYYEGVDEPTPMHEATKENLLALIAESDDDEPVPAPARPAKKPRYVEDVEHDADEDAWAAADPEEELFA